MHGNSLIELFIYNLILLINIKYLVNNYIYSIVLTH